MIGEEPMADPFLVDPERSVVMPRTGIYVRAKLGEHGPMVNADIAWLDTDSLTRFLRSRGGDNPWAESVVLALLGHPRDD